MPGGRFLRVLLGATASGKEDAALRCAERLGGEIVSVDSMKVYRGLDVGTAKPGPEQRARVPHHCLDLAGPEENFSVADYVRAAETALEEIFARNAAPVLSGGTALYYKGLLEGLCNAPPADETLREELRQRAGAEGPEKLHAELARSDPQAAAKIHPRDARRLIRALEVLAQTGEPLSSRQRQWQGFAETRDLNHPAVPAAPAYRYPCCLVGLSWPRETLHRRIAARVERMLQRGLLDEAEQVYRRRETCGRAPLQAVGYKEFFPYFAGACGLPEATELLRRNTRRLAKAQLTWFRKFPCRWIAMDDSRPPESAAAAALSVWDEAERTMSFPA